MAGQARWTSQPGTARIIAAALALTIRGVEKDCLRILIRVRAGPTPIDAWPLALATAPSERGSCVSPARRYPKPVALRNFESCAIVVAQAPVRSLRSPTKAN
jgi:hypothetical protein